MCTGRSFYYRGREAPQPVTEQPPYDVPRIPEVDTGQFVFRGERDGGRIRMHLIEFAENSVDFRAFPDRARAFSHSGNQHSRAGHRH